ncbi:MAG: sigma-70 family RNA polymerase sigma factor [Candidatus Pseudobacter hemicellulosilyticus]|uniref:Sigma-70 family RNA polymerase sigma factor n=1 Tax=Candidatus Pseudobacter hemicellulosilyticus TaxID=3121375 RepID=A0AAJ5WU12_9BACT|nr:MAG: sigma-70 family RNA polymerase sigma factor [Pseudobacter sp.]
MPEPGKYAMSNDQQFLYLLAEGDEQAFRELYDQYKSRVFQLALGYLPHEDAVEVTQQVFIHLWDGRARLSDVNSLTDYILISTRNQVFRHIKRIGRQAKLLLEAADGAVSASVTPEQVLGEKKLLKTWEAVIRRLPPQQQQVYQLVELEGLSLDEVTQQLQLARATVKKHLELARKQVRQELKRRLN